MTEPAPRVVSTGTCCGTVPGGIKGKPQAVCCILCPESVAYHRSPDRPEVVGRWDEKSGRGLLGMKVTGVETQEKSPADE